VTSADDVDEATPARPGGQRSAEAQRAHFDLRPSLQKALGYGLALLDRKRRVKHGAWRGYVRAHYPFSLRTAQLYMRIPAASKRSPDGEGTPAVSTRRRRTVRSRIVTALGGLPGRWRQEAELLRAHGGGEAAATKLLDAAELDRGAPPHALEELTWPSGEGDGLQHVATPAALPRRRTIPGDLPRKGGVGGPDLGGRSLRDAEALPSWWDDDSPGLRSAKRSTTPALLAGVGPGPLACPTSPCSGFGRAWSGSARVAATPRPGVSAWATEHAHEAQQCARAATRIRTALQSRGGGSHDADGIQDRPTRRRRGRGGRGRRAATGRRCSSSPSGRTALRPDPREAAGARLPTRASAR